MNDTSNFDVLLSRIAERLDHYHGQLLIKALRDAQLRAGNDAQAVWQLQKLADEALQQDLKICGAAGIGGAVVAALLGPLVGLAVVASFAPLLEARDHSKLLALLEAAKERAEASGQSIEKAQGEIVDRAGRQSERGSARGRGRERSRDRDLGLGD